MLMPDEIACLKYLDDGRMEATGRMIGEAIAPKEGRTTRGYAVIGNKVARNLHILRGGLTTYLPDLNAWRITAAGRETLRKEQPTASLEATPSNAQANEDSEPRR